MRKYSIHVLLCFLAGFNACREWEGIDFQSDQDIEWINEVKINGNPEDYTDFLLAYGEENIHFGYNPPRLDSISFFVDGMDYITCDRYVYKLKNNNYEIEHLATTSPSGSDGLKYYYLFYNHIGNISNFKTKVSAPHEDVYGEKDTVYVIGSGNDFTAYYYEITEQSGRPINFVIISGTLEYDQEGNFTGVSNYRYGKKIIKINEPPTPENPSFQGFAEGTIEIKKHEGLAPYSNWDQ